MKKCTSIILAVAMLFSVAMTVLAESNQKLNETIIATVREKLDISENHSSFDFSSHESEERGLVWEFRWSWDNDKNIRASADAEGRIIDYYRYASAEDNSSKLPAYTLEQCREKSLAFLRRANPELDGHYVLADESDSAMNGSYAATYHRVENDIPYPDHTIYVVVDSFTGEVSQYRVEWDYTLAFKPLENGIGDEAATDSYQEKLGLRLQYMTRQKDGKTEAYLAYVPKYQNTYLDAETGEPYYAEQLPHRLAGSAGGGYSADAAAEMSSKNLSEAERQEIQNAEGLISKDEAAAFVKKIPAFDITDDMMLESTSLYSTGKDKKEYAIELRFIKEGEDTYHSVSIVLNAKNKEVLSYYSYDSSVKGNEADKNKMTQAQVAQEAQKFIDTYAASKAGEIAVRETNPFVKNVGESGVINYERIVNGIPYPDNGISVAYDLKTGKLSRFRTSWDSEASFESKANILSDKEALQKILEIGPLSLLYVGIPDEEGGLVKDTKPVYGLPFDFTGVLSATTGEQLDWRGKPYVKKEIRNYTDIVGHWSEEYVKKLCEFGFDFGKGEFKPEEAIVQKDYLVLLLEAINNDTSAYETEEEITDLYERLIRQGILGEEERNPGAPITRIDAAKYFVRMIGGEDFAAIKGIYQTPFSDEAEIGEDLLGYAAIVSGMGIMNGSDGMFQPNGSITRAETAVMLYKYLAR